MRNKAIARRTVSLFLLNIFRKTSSFSVFSFFGYDMFILLINELLCNGYCVYRPLRRKVSQKLSHKVPSRPDTTLLYIRNEDSVRDREIRYFSSVYEK